MITYNHGKFIEQAIEGVLMQQTDFPVELVIGEDCSPDDTREICIRYQQKYPDRIKLHLPEKNIGSLANFEKILWECSKGYKYTAMCEGDDYWSDPLKLQKQVDYLEAHPDCGLTYTDVKIFDDARKEFLPHTPGKKIPDEDMVRTLLEAKFIHFASIMVRTAMLPAILEILSPEWQGKIIGDTRLILEYAQQARIGFIPEATTVYRIVAGSASHPVNIDKFISVVNDTYQSRKNFVLRHKLDEKWLGIPVSHYNRSLINHAATQKNYFNAVKLLSNLKIRDSFSYATWKTFRRKIDNKTAAKFAFSLFGLGVLRLWLKK